MRKIITTSSIVVMSLIASNLFASLNKDFLETTLENLKIEISGKRNEKKVTLPTDLNQSAQWGVVNFDCTNGGYNLSAYLGQTLTLTSFPIKQFYKAEPLDVHVLSKNTNIVCVYLSVRAESNLTPGIFAVNNPNIQNK